MTETVFRLIQPLCLGNLVAYFAPGQTEYTKQEAYWYAGGIIVSSAYQVLTSHPFFLWLLEVGARMRVGCSGLVYRKALSLPKAAVSDGISGQLINLLANDLIWLELAMAFVHDIWKGPLEACLFGYFIYREIGVGAIVGILFLLSFVPIQGKSVVNFSSVKPLIHFIPEQRTWAKNQHNCA